MAPESWQADGKQIAIGPNARQYVWYSGWPQFLPSRFLFFGASTGPNLEKDLTPDIKAYVGYSTGFKGSIYNTTDIFAPAVKPETIKDLEGGIKSELFDHRLRLNAAVYHYDYEHLQVTSLTR